MATRSEERSWALFYVGALFLASFIIFFINLDGRSLWGSDEPREGQIAREMIETGDYIIPRLNGEVLPWKPPLYHWLIALSSGLGKVTAFSIRFPSALLGTGGVLLTFVLGRKLLSDRGGFLAGLILLSSGQYWWLARYGRIDMTLTFFFTLSLVFFWLGLNYKRKRLFYLLFYVSMGLATLSKGPVGLVLPCLVVFAYLLTTRQLARIKEMELALGPVLFIAVAGPWYVLSEIKGGPGFTYELVVRQSFIRFLNAFDHHDPIWAYFPYFAWYFAPWSILLPASISAVFSKEARDRRKDLLFPLVWFAMVFVFFSLSESKRSIYILPLYPAASLMVAYGWQRLIETTEGGGDFKRFRLSVAALAGVLVVSSMLAPLYAQAEMPEWFLVSLVAVPVILSLCLGMGYVMFIKTRARRAFCLLFGMTVGVLLLYSFLVVPKIDARISSKPFAERIKTAIGESSNLRTYVTARPALLFYLGRHIDVIDTVEALESFLNSQNRVYILVKKSDYSELVRRDNRPLYVLDGGPVYKETVYLVSNRP